MENDREFLIRLMEKLNSDASDDNYHLDALEDLCHFLGYGSCFVYEVAYDSTCTLQDSFSVYEGPQLPAMLSLHKALSPELEQDLASRKLVAFRANSSMDALSTTFSRLFGAKSLVLVPIRDAKNKLVAFVGMLDRRGEARASDDDTEYIYSVLLTLANHIKMQVLQKRVETTHRALDSIINNMGVDVYVNDFYTHEVLYVNKSMAAPYGGVDAMMGRTCWEALYDDKTEECDFCPQKRLVDSEGNPTKVYSWDYQRPFDGSWFRVLSASFRWVDERLAHVVSSIDITEQKHTEELMLQLAEFDQLTKLPNRFRIAADCDAFLAKAVPGTEGYLLFFDLDGFKAVNDQLGHPAGDDLLVKVSAALENSPLTKGRSYRYGGDEFVVLVTGDAVHKIWEIITFLQETFTKPWPLESGHQVYVGASIGISHYPMDAGETSNLLRQADQAMYVSKRAGKGLASFYNHGNPCPPAEYLSPPDKL